MRAAEYVRSLLRASTARSLVVQREVLEELVATPPEAERELGTRRFGVFPPLSPHDEEAGRSYAARVGLTDDSDDGHTLAIHAAVVRAYAAGRNDPSTPTGDREGEGLAGVMGKWPGNETDEDLLAALAEMDGKVLREDENHRYPEKPIHWVDVGLPHKLPALVFESEEQYREAVGLLNRARDTEKPRCRWSEMGVGWTAEEWNTLYKPGVNVRYYPVAGEDEHIDTKTRSMAWTLDSGEALVAIDGRPGGVSLRHLLFFMEPSDVWDEEADEHEGESEA